MLRIAAGALTNLSILNLRKSPEELPGRFQSQNCVVLFALEVKLSQHFLLQLLHKKLHGWKTLSDGFTILFGGCHIAKISGSAANFEQLDK